MLEWLKNSANDAHARLSAEASRFRNRTFMESVVSGCALLAAADGEIKPEEKQKMAGFMQRADELKHFDTRQVIEVFNKVVSDFEFDETIGKAEALKTISKIKGKEEQARLLVRVVCAIGASDGDFDDDEQAAAREICRELALDPAEFDL